MTQAEFPIPPGALRERHVVWHDALQARALGEGLTGLEIMRGIRDGTMPEPPMASLMGVRCVVAEPGEVAMRIGYDPSLENPIGIFHGGAAATLLDSAMGCAVLTMLPVGSGMVTLDLTITYLRPITSANAPARATGRVLNLGGRSAYVTGEVRDAGDVLVAHAVANFTIIRPRADGSVPWSGS